jgi:hypothetical protein
LYALVLVLSVCVVFSATPPSYIDDITYFWDFEGTEPLLDVIQGEPLTDYGADFLTDDSRCQNNSDCYEFGLSEGYLAHEGDTGLVKYRDTTICAYVDYEDDSLFSVFFDSVGGTSGRYWSIVLTSPDTMRWGVNSGTGDISQGNIDELGSYYWCTTMSNTTNEITSYRDGVLIGSDPSSISDVWSNWNTDTNTLIGKLVGSNNYLEGTMDNLLLINTILNETEIEVLYNNSGVPPTLYESDSIVSPNTIQFPSSFNVSVYDDPYDAFNWTQVMRGNGVCPLDNGSTDRLFYMFIIVIAFVLFVFAFTVDNSLFGTLASILLFYIGMLSARCDVFLSGILILIAMIGLYLSFTQLSLTKT